jgi:hypothetical protein
MDKLLILYSVLFSILFSTASSSIDLVSTTRGSIEAGNYTYFYLSEKGTFKLVLISLEGDCDLYVSDKHRLVSFENYDFQSITYGNDIVWLTEDMKRPISIGIYAHPYYVKSTFVLNKYRVTFDSKSFNYEYSHISEENNDLNNKYDEDVFESHHSNEHDNSETKTKNNENQNDEDEEYDDDIGVGGGSGGRSFLWSLFIHLIEIIAEVFL